MTTYRVLWLDEKQNSPKSEQIECSTDEQAIDIAERQTGKYDVIEVWDGSRLVCRCSNPDRMKKG